MTFNTETDVAQFGTTPDLLTLAAEGSHPGWVVLNSARESHYTGEIVFGTTKEIRVYFDNGAAYHAVRDGDPTLCQLLLEARIVDTAQIERGVVRVGNVEHLGRLFDRDASVDRDAVMVLMEMETESILTALANGDSGAFRVTAYRHHASGIHRWFVAPTDPAQLAPIGHVAQIDGSVTSELPGLPVADGSHRGDDLRIEWDEPVIGESPVVERADALEPLDASMLQSMLDAEAESSVADFDPDQADWGQPQVVQETPADASVLDLTDVTDEVSVADLANQSVEETTSPLLDIDEFVVSNPAVDEERTPEILAFDDEFQILWPDGTEEVLAETIDEPATTEVTTPRAPTEDSLDELPSEPLENPAELPAVHVPAAVDIPTAEVPIVEIPTAEVPIVEMPTAEVPDVEVASQPDLPVLVQDDGAFRFNLPALATTEDEVPDDQQPEEVVDAVRRALVAIETATSAEPALPSMDGTIAGEALLPGLQQPAVSPFAPPTLSTSVEVMYARAAEQAQEAAQVVETQPASTAGVASVVFVDDDEDSGTGERSGALRRLISSLRRK